MKTTGFNLIAWNHRGWCVANCLYDNEIEATEEGRRLQALGHANHFNVYLFEKGKTAKLISKG